MNNRAGTVSDNCLNDWHNSRPRQSCPECPSQPGLKLALARVQSLVNVREFGGDDAGPLADALDEISSLIYVPKA
jgi:hypothetical protein